MYARAVERMVSESCAYCFANGERTIGQSQHVVSDQHLAVALGSCPIPIVGIFNFVVTRPARSDGIDSRTIANTPDFRAPPRPSPAFSRLRITALWPETSQLMNRLRSQSKVSHHRHSNIDQPFRRIDNLPAALDLHRRRPPSWISRPAFLIASSMLS